jgi:hypothetical protein
VNGATPGSKASSPGNDVMPPSLSAVVKPTATGDDNPGSTFKPPTSDANAAAPVPNLPPLPTSPDSSTAQPMMSVSPAPQSQPVSPVPAPNPNPDPAPDSDFALDATPKDMRAGPVNATPSSPRILPTSESDDQPDSSAPSPTSGPNFALNATPKDMKVGPVNSQPTVLPPPEIVNLSPSSESNKQQVPPAPSPTPDPNFAEKSTPPDTKAGPVNVQPPPAPAPAPAPESDFAQEATPQDLRASPSNGQPDNNFKVIIPDSPQSSDSPTSNIASRPATDQAPSTSAPVPAPEPQPQPAPASQPKPQPAPAPAPESNFAQAANPTSTTAGPVNGLLPISNLSNGVTNVGSKPSLGGLPTSKIGGSEPKLSL